MNRVTEHELVHLVAYENLYGQIGAERWDTLFARLGMDVAAPNMKKGKKPKFEDHKVAWPGDKKKQQTPEEMKAKAKQLHALHTKGSRRSQRRTGREGKRQPDTGQ